MDVSPVLATAQSGVAGWAVWRFTTWLSANGISDLLAAVGTVAATSFAVWQAGATGRERREAVKASRNVALWGIERALEVLADPDFTTTYKGSQCRGVLSTLMEIPVIQLGSAPTVRALIHARAALHVIADRADASRAARAANPGTAVLQAGFADQISILQNAACDLRERRGRLMFTQGVARATEAKPATIGKG